MAAVALGDCADEGGRVFVDVLTLVSHPLPDAQVAHSLCSEDFDNREPPVRVSLGWRMRVVPLGDLDEFRGGHGVGNLESWKDEPTLS